MRYYVRKRGQDEVTGPFSQEELEASLGNGTLSASHLVLEERNRTADCVREHWKYKWAAISSLPGLERHTPAILQAPANALPPAAVIESARNDMLVGASICGLGIMVTVGSYLFASQSSDGGSYVIAWGAIAFGALRFFRGSSVR